MKKISFLLFLLFNTNIFYAQCPDATAKKYKAKTDKGENVQSCSQCAMLALYLCSAKHAVNPDDRKKLTELISNIKGNINFMGSPICCPELLNARPQWGSASGGGKNTGVGGSKSTGASGNGPAGGIEITKDDMIEAANILASSVDAFVMTMDAIDKILPDPEDKFREPMSKWKYAWEENNGSGKGKGSIIFLDSAYVFNGEISRGIAKKGKMKIGKYGYFEGDFLTKDEGGIPYLGNFITNFGVNYKVQAGEKYGISRRFTFENGDEIFFTGPLFLTLNYSQKSTGKTYKVGRKKFESYHESIDKIFPISSDTEMRNNYYRYLLTININFIAQYFMVELKGQSVASMMFIERTWEGLSRLESKYEIDEELKIWHEMIKTDLNKN